MLRIGSCGLPEPTGRLCGGGSGGTIFVLAEPKHHEEIRALCVKENLINISYKIDQEGSKRII